MRWLSSLSGTWMTSIAASPTCRSRPVNRKVSLNCRCKFLVIEVMVNQSISVCWRLCSSHLHFYQSVRTKEAMSEKQKEVRLLSTDALNSGGFAQSTRAGEGKQTNGAAAAAAALTHGPHSQPPPTSLCSSEKKPLLFLKAGREGGLWGELSLCSTTPPAIKKNK